MEISLLACSIYSMYSPDRRERERERRGLKLPRRNGERRSRGPLELFGSTLATPLLLETPRDERVPRRRGVRPSTNLGWISTRRAIQNQTRWNNRYTSVICSNKTFHLWFLALIFLLNLNPPIDPPPTTQINYCRVSNFTPSRLFLSSGRRERVRDPSLPPLSPRKLLLVIEFPPNPLRGHVLLHFAKLEQHRISLSRSSSSSRHRPLIPNSSRSTKNASFNPRQISNFADLLPQPSLIRHWRIYPIPSCNYYRAFDHILSRNDFYSNCVSSRLN